MSHLRALPVSSSNGRAKSAHASRAHLRFNAAPPAVATAQLSDPFSVYAEKLLALESAASTGALASHHLVVDCVRVLEDVLVHAAQTFLEHRTPAPLLALTVEYAAQGVAERLRDAEVISPWANRQIEEARKLARWVLVSSAREVTREASHNLLLFVSKLNAAFVADVERANADQPQQGCTANHAFCRDMMPQHLDQVGGPHNAHTVPPPSTTRPGTAVEADPVAPSADGLVPNGVSVPSGGLANPDSKKLKPKPRAHDALPYGWSAEEFELHCAPLHNTAHLDLQAQEDEEDETEREAQAALEAERADRIRLREEAAERRRERREAEEASRAARAGLGPDGDLSDLDENEDEVDSEEERLTARRREARAAAGEGDAASESDEYDSDEDDETRAARAERKVEVAARKAQEAEDEQVANEPIPAVAPKPLRFAFTFCCIVCHSVLMRARDIDRIQSNQVWSKTGRGLHGKSLLKNFADTWHSRPADEREPIVLADDEEEEEPVAEDDDDELAGPDAPPKDEGAAKREESIGVMCAGCDYYVGRYFPVRDAYRLIYIQRSTGQNFMYYTGDASADRLRPAIVRRSEADEEADEARAQEEEQGSDEEDDVYAARREAAAEAKRTAPVPPVIGLPAEYVDVRQAALYPFPRFGSARPYNRPSSWMLFHAMITDAERAAKMVQDALPKTAEEEKSNSPSSASSPFSPSSTSKSLGLTGLLSTRSSGGAAGVKSKCNSRTFRPLIPSVPLVHTMLRRHPDAQYELPPEDAAHAKATTADLSVLLWTDRVFHNRRAMDAVTARVVAMFTSFPSGVYANTANPVVPLFTYFYVKDAPDFTMARGTARYIFHLLTKKDDSKVKRQQFTHRKFIKSLAKFENAVYHLSAGGYGGHRFVLVKVGQAYRIFQSNNCLDARKDRFTALQWLASDYPWSRTLDQSGLLSFLAKFEEARRGRRQVWQELFTVGQRAQGLYDISDTWQPDQVFFAHAKLLDTAIEL